MALFTMTVMSVGPKHFVFPRVVHIIILIVINATRFCWSCIVAGSYFELSNSSPIRRHPDVYMYVHSPDVRTASCVYREVCVLLIVLFCLLNVQAGFHQCDSYMRRCSALMQPIPI